jgi:hypothetical protein
VRHKAASGHLRQLLPVGFDYDDASAVWFKDDAVGKRLPHVLPLRRPGQGCGPLTVRRRTAPAGEPQGALTASSSSFAVIGEFVADPERYVETPTEPSAWSPAVESLVVRCQADGSAVPAFQTWPR